MPTPLRWLCRVSPRRCSRRYLRVRTTADVLFKPGVDPHRPSIASVRIALVTDAVPVCTIGGARIYVEHCPAFRRTDAPDLSRCLYPKALIRFPRLWTTLAGFDSLPPSQFR